MKKLLALTLFVLSSTAIRANIILPAIFGDHMVLQQKSDVTIWGWAKPNEKIKIVGSWDRSKEYTLTVNNQSAWSLVIQTPSAGGPYELTVQGYNTIQINDVLIGEVWLGSGQSNMEWTPQSRIDNAEEERAKANYPELRFFTVQVLAADKPQQQLIGHWVVCTPETMNNSSAIMYFFGQELYEKLKVPVGLINSSWGGTPIEIWMPDYCVTGDKVLREGATLVKPAPWGPNEPGRAYNSMIHPLIPFKIKGALWYQGEANTSNANNYARSLNTLISSWRSLWGYEFPFYFAQIAPYGGYGTDNVDGARVRDQQRRVLDITDHTGMAVLSDIGDLKNIHPGNKKDAGKRLAFWALHDDYGFTNIPYSGPLYQSFEVKKDKVIVHFNHAEGGLMAKDSELREFEILDDNGEWVATPAKINGAVVEIDVKGKSFKGIRFGYHNDSNPNLFNKAGLPASCFEVLMK
ncbi:MAG TPA: sialate O-acetylesterase [Cyclobacteriaceae bacterium]|nr:sialate O-acetylesterase [Cyclobacteriaceae bacterium]